MASVKKTWVSPFFDQSVKPGIVKLWVAHIVLKFHLEINPAVHGLKWPGVVVLKFQVEASWILSRADIFGGGSKS